MADARGFTSIGWQQQGGGVVNLNQSIDTGTCYIETKDLDLGRVDFTKFLQRIIAKIDGVEDAPYLVFYVKWKDELGDALQEQGPFSFDGHESHAVRPPGAKFYRIRIQDNGVSTRWRLSMLELFGAVGGRRATN